MHARCRNDFFKFVHTLIFVAEDVHESDIASRWFKELHTLATLTGSKTREAESLASFQAVNNFLSKEKRLIATLGRGWFKSSLKAILPWMRQIVSTLVDDRIFGVFLLLYGNH
jgi:hypothetical protein